MCYTGLQRWDDDMDKSAQDLYQLENIGAYEDIHLLTLSEQCAVLEDRVRAIALTLPDRQRLIIEEYINTRDDLDTETVKTALRWGKKHYR